MVWATGRLTELRPIQEEKAESPMLMAEERFTEVRP
jgi:hypothetical protein